VVAARPAAWPAHSVLKLLLGAAYPAGPGLVLLRILNPTDELVAGKWSDVLPPVKRDGIGKQCLPKIGGKPVDNSARDTLAHR
jgi:hypothetical protein